MFFLLSIGYNSSKRLFRYAAVDLAGAVGLNWGVTNWEVILRFLYGVPTELRDPVFARTSGFYLFTLPMLDAGRNLLFLISLIALGATAADAYLSLDGRHSINVQDRVDEARIGAVYRSVGAVVVISSLWRTFPYGRKITHKPLIARTCGVLFCEICRYLNDCRGHQLKSEIEK